MTFDIWWQTLDPHLHTSNSKGSKALAKQAWDKLSPDEKLVEHILWYTREKLRQDRKLKSQGSFVGNWPHAVRLIKNRFWEDELLQSEQIEKLPKSKCKCGKKAEIGNLCGICYDKKVTDPWKAIRKAEAERLDLVRGTKRETIERCKSFLRETGMLKKVLDEGKRVS